MLDILQQELVKSMRLCGVTSLDQLKPSMLNTVSLERPTMPVPIPASPYAYRPPPVGVRSPEYPKPEELDAARPVWELVCLVLAIFIGG